jgi:hypothetical protein
VSRKAIDTVDPFDFEDARARMRTHIQTIVSVKKSVADERRNRKEYRIDVLLPFNQRPVDFVGVIVANHRDIRFHYLSLPIGNKDIRIQLKEAFRACDRDRAHPIVGTRMHTFEELSQTQKVWNLVAYVCRTHYRKTCVNNRHVGNLERNKIFDLRTHVS